jgi:molybdopterin synthase sulfur carrier subunit|tara:strand:+ start:260 stop:511 length:252 start_codon:yes stop_codon:yes gene_type:complete
MKILYFSWLKEKIGTNSEEIDKPIKVETVMDLIQFLKNISKGHEDAFTHLKSVKVAVNKNFANFETEINNNDEIAFFPPVTGG